MDALDHVTFSHAPTDTFFLEQTSNRKPTKRRKKSGEDLPEDLRSPHGRFAFLANKGRDEKDSLDDSLLTSRSSLLPQIHETFNLIRHSFNTNLLNDEYSQRFIFQETKRHSIDILVALADYLYIPKSRPVNLPRKLELTLNANYGDLTSEVQVVRRDWPTYANEDDMPRGVKEHDVSKDSLSVTSRVDDDVRSVTSRAPSFTSKATSSSSMPDPGGKKTIHKPKTARSSNGNILKSKSAKPDHLEDIAEGADETPQTPKSGKGLWSRVNLKDNRLSSGSGRRALTKSNITASFLETLSQSSKSAAERNAYYTVIQFQLSSQDCDDKGWIVHEDKNKDKKMSDCALQHARKQLRDAINAKKEEDQQAKQIGHDKPVILKYYGEGHTRKKMVQSAPAGLRSPIKIPDHGDYFFSDQRVFLTTIPDGTTTIFYKSRRPAVISTTAGIGQPGFYTIIYDDNMDKTMLGCFTASGHGCCYHSNGLVHFLITETGGTLADEYGAITRRWNWPPGHGAKLAVSINLRLNAFMQLRCLSKTNITLHFSSQKESAKVSLGAVPGVEGAKSKELGLLQPNIAFNQTAAKDFTKSKSSKSAPALKDKKSKNAKKLQSFQQGQVKSLTTMQAITTTYTILPPKLDKKMPSQSVNTKDTHLPVIQVFDENDQLIYDAVADINQEKKNPLLQNPELQKLIDFPEVTINDADADKDLQRLQRKVRNLVDGWLEHYCIHVGIKTPHLQKMREFPRNKFGMRNIHSAKSSPAGVRVILESLSGQIPRATLAPRIPSAPPGRTENSDFNDTISERAYSLHAKREVTFDSNPALESELSEVTSLDRSTSYLHTMGYGPPQRARSAPPKRKVLSAYPEAPVKSANQNQCPIAVHNQILGQEKPFCRCTRHKVPFIKDLEFDQLIFNNIPEEQLAVIAVYSSQFTPTTPSLQMLEKLFSEMNKNRSRPCLQCSQDEMRFFLYDTAVAADNTDHIQPLLPRRHNVVPGMFLMYKGGRLLFCDHIFNGYGKEKKDFLKQISMVQQAYQQWHYMPDDFRFSPLKGKKGKRAPWGGEIGGAGADRQRKRNKSPNAGRARMKGKKYTSSFSIDGSDSSGSCDYPSYGEYEEPLTKIFHLEATTISSNYTEGNHHDYMSTVRSSHGFSYLAVPSVSDSFMGSLATSSVFA